MKSYTFDDPALGQIQYVDKKRYLWWTFVLFPMIAMLGMGLMLLTGSEWMLWTPLVITYVLIPLLDYLFPNDSSNPPEQIVPQLEADSYYRILCHLPIPLYFVVLVAGAWFVAGHDLGWAGLIALSLSVGLSGGLSLNTGHELGHKKNTLDRAAARLALAVPFYGHFCIEHNAGHHAQVATPEDSASSRRFPAVFAADGAWKKRD
jgi:alkane 1-monooxygenase